MNSNNQPQPLPGHTSNNEVSETTNQNQSQQHNNPQNNQEQQSHAIEPAEIKNWLNQILIL